MKKLLIILASLIAVFVIILGIGLAYVFSSGFQRGVVIGQLEKAGATEIQLKDISVGLSSAEVTGLDFKLNGAHYSFPEVNAQLSILGLVGGELNADQIIVKDFLVDLGAAEAPSEEALPDAGEEVVYDDEAPAPFEGILLPGLQAPMPITIGKIDISGILVAPDKQQYDLAITGGSLAPGAAGELSLKTTITHHGAAPFETSHIAGTLNIRQAEGGGINRLAGDITANLQGQSSVANQLIFAIEANDSTNEHYQLTFVTGDNSSEGLKLSGDFNSETHELAGIAQGTIAPTPLLSMLSGQPMPTLRITPNNKFTLNTESNAGTANVELRIVAGNLANVDASLAHLPDATVRVLADIAFNEQRVSVSGLDGTIETARGESLLKLNALTAFDIPLSGAMPDIPDSELARLDVPGLPLAYLAPFIQGMNITAGSLSGIVTLSKSGDTYQMNTINPITLHKIAVSQGGQPMLKDLTIPLTPTLTFNPEQEQLDAQLQGSLIPGEGSTPTSLNITSRIQLANGAVDNLSVNSNVNMPINPWRSQPAATAALSQLPAGDFALSLESALDYQASGSLTIKQLTSTVNYNGSSLLNATLAQQITLPTNGSAVELDDFQGELAQISIQQLPAALIAAVLPTNIALSGDAITASFSIANENSALKISTLEPWALTNINLAMDGQPLLRSFSGALSPTITHYPADGKTHIKLAGLALSDGQVMLATGYLNASIEEAAMPLKNIELQLEGSLAGLLSQPALTPVNNVRTGSFALKGKLNTDGSAASSLNLNLGNLRTRMTERTLEDVKLGFQGTLNAGNAIDGSLPISISSNLGQTSTQVDINFKTEEQQTSLDLAFNGNTLIVDDLILLAEAFQKPNAAASAQPAQPSAPSQPTAPQDGPFWPAMNGRVTTDLQRVLFDTLEIKQLQGAFEMTPDRMELKSLNAIILDAPASAKGALLYTQGVYELGATVNISQFDLGNYLATTSGKKPAATGIFLLDSQIQGKAASMHTIGDTMTGRVSLLSESGAFYGLRSMGDLTETIGGDFIGGILGTANDLTGGKVGVLNVGKQVINFLREVPYDVMQLNAVRGEDLNLQLNDIQVINPQAFIYGQGMVTHKEGVPLPEQPMTIKLTLAAKGDLAKALNTLGLLTEEEAGSGYMIGPTFEIKGTLAAPDTKDVLKVLSGKVLDLLPTKEGTSETLNEAGKAVEGVLKGLFQ